MTIRQLPVAPAGRPCAGVTSEPLPSALERWNGGIRAATDNDNAISIFDVVGRDYWDEGVTAKRISGALRSMNGADVTVNINSPGGDMFEGLAIYNLLREYEGHVTVKVLGIAASAASIIAMAGDDIQIGRGAFLMIHNCWLYAMGTGLGIYDASNYSIFASGNAPIARRRDTQSGVWSFIHSVSASVIPWGVD
ncbi:head maturation protease, ClpP-related, partial [Klebsiella variicola]|uniref:head maturation protease, ClpP-related n=1 Tax=Klebsiella variicola TaxID=244366 RepID=UPI0029290EC6